jgi:hypothetical protein
VREVQALGLGPEGRLRRPWWFGWLRAYGYLLAAEKISGHGSKNTAEAGRDRPTSTPRGTRS